MSPERGPAIQTSDVRDFVRPSWRRYGVQSTSISISERGKWEVEGVHDISTPHVNLQCQTISILITKLYAKKRTHETPVKLNAKRAILVASDRPLMEGEPVHDAALIPVVVPAKHSTYSIKWSHI